MKIKWVQQCKSCGGVGLYVGMAERDGAAVVCNACEGSGREQKNVEYEEFTGRKERKGITRVYRISSGIVLAPSVVKGGVSLDEWEKDSESVNRRGAEIRDHVCPAWWYQSADSRKNPNWEECKDSWGRSFSNCRHFKNKAHCWDRFDKEQEAATVSPVLGAGNKYI